MIREHDGDVQEALGKAGQVSARSKPRDEPASMANPISVAPLSVIKLTGALPSVTHTSDVENEEYAASRLLQSISRLGEAHVKPAQVSIGISGECLEDSGYLRR